MAEAQYLVALITIFISLIVSLLSLVITKENKISEFREEWVNDLRNEISTYLSLLHEFKISWFLFNQKQDTDYSVFFTTNLAKIKEIRQYRENIVFRLNDKDDKELIESIKEINYILEDFEKINNTDLYEKEHDFIVSKSKNLLKKEWEKVKTGEILYQYIKKIFIIFAPLSLIGIFMLIGVKTFYKETKIVIENKYTINTVLKNIVFHFEKSQLILDKNTNKNAFKELTDFLNNKKEILNNKFYITVTGYASNEQLINQNKISNNYELSLARANNIKQVILETLKLYNIPTENIHFNIYGYSNEQSTDFMNENDRKVEVIISKIQSVESVIKNEK